MIIHQYADGSEGYQFEIGDRVIVNRTIHGGWFDIGPTNSTMCMVVKSDVRGNWRTAELDIRYSHDWGPAKCFPWMLTPHAETLATARTVKAT